MGVFIHLILGAVTMVALGAAWTTTIGMTDIAPVPVAVVAFYLGVTSRDRLARAVLAALALGYIADVLAGSPKGLCALSAGLLCVVGHIVSGRYVLGKALITAIASWLVALLYLLFALAIGHLVGLGDAYQLTLNMWVLLFSGLVTAVIGPIQFFIHRRIDARLARTVRERDAALEGIVAG